MGLEEYKKKRRFNRTSEPAGKKLVRRRSRPLSFVIHKHAARRLHYDLRLELDGVLKSWAVPKGPSLNPENKRLAVQVEDHPLDYAAFEGVIPQGEYGAGPVIVWDRGRWHPVSEPHDALRNGHLHFTLAGKKVKGVFSLIRIGGRAAEEGKVSWLLVKEQDKFARASESKEIVERKPRSVKSGKPIEALIAGAASKGSTGSAGPRGRRSSIVNPILSPALQARLKKKG